jgi:hypothetical protein
MRFTLSASEPPSEPHQHREKSILFETSFSSVAGNRQCGVLAAFTLAVIPQSVKSSTSATQRMKYGTKDAAPA